MKKTILLLFIAMTGVALLAQGPPPGPGFGPRGFGRGPGGPGGVGRAIVTGAPYSGTETTSTVQTLASGNTITHQNINQVYRDSQGRTRIETTITPPADSGRSPFTEIVINDVVGGYRYRLNSSNMTAFQTPLPRPRTPSTTNMAPHTRPERPGVTSTTSDLGTQSVNGIPAAGKQITETIASGAIGNAAPLTITRTSFVSTDLKVPVSIKTSDPRFGSTDMELTNISAAEPAATLFQVPSNYTIKTGGPGGFGGRGGRFGHPPQQQ
jgi:hypothetical protein